MDSKTYWKNRTESKLRMGDKSIAVLKNECQRLYKISLRNINKEIEAFYGRYATMNKLTVAEVNKRLDPKELKSAKEEIKAYYDLVNKLCKDNEGKISVELLRKYKEKIRLQSARAYMSRLEGLKASLEYHLVDMGFREEIKFHDELSRLCGDVHSLSSYEIDKQLGFSAGYDSLPSQKINQLVNERWLGENYSDRIWKDKGKLIDDINNIFLQGIARGQNPSVMAKEISKKYGTSFYNAERLCITESAHITESATMETYRQHGVDEIEFVATLDEHTCPICGELDGKHYPRKEAVTGGNYPPVHPNCRCTTVAYFEPDEIDKMFEDYRIARENGSGEWYEVPADMTYQQWKDTIGE